MEFDIVSLLIVLVVQIVLQIPVLWVVGRILTSSQNAKFTDAIMIVVLSNIANVIVGMFLTDIIATVIQVVVYLLLIKKYYECDWVKAIMVAIVVGIVSAIIGAGLAIFLGIGLGGYI
jgi:hypothetical protein